MNLKVCEGCGDEWHISKFRSKGKLTPHCPKCRNRLRAREYQRRKRKENNEALAKRHIRVALQKQRYLRDNDYAKAVIKELKQLQAQPKQRIKMHEEKLAYGAQTAWTESRLQWQKQKLAYFKDVERIVRKDIEHNNLKPVDYYLTNTWLLNKHGFPVTVVDENPEEDYGEENGS